VGPFVGSFLFAGALRYPQMRGFTTGRSACPACGHPIAARDLVPIVSWALLRGRCRACAAPISWQYPMVELAAAAIPLWASTELSGAVLWIGCGLGSALLVLALIDLRCFRLRDSLTLPLLVAGLIVTALVWPADLPDHLLGSVLGYTALAAIGWVYRSMRGREGLGLGDAKLLASGGAWLSWQALPSIVTIAAMLALTVVLVAWTLREMPPFATTRMPFGPYLAGAIWLIWLYGPLAF
jgi:leader peptidase (prepilin peptidase) / N-methyltransferase